MKIESKVQCCVCAKVEEWVWMAAFAVTAVIAKATVAAIRRRWVTASGRKLCLAEVAFLSAAERRPFHMQSCSCGDGRVEKCQFQVCLQGFPWLSHAAYFRRCGVVNFCCARRDRAANGLSTQLWPENFVQIVYVCREGVRICRCRSGSEWAKLSP